MVRVSTVVAGCDPHLDTVTMAIIDPLSEHPQRVVTVPNRPDGWDQLIEECRAWGVGTVGVEGASGFGRGLATRMDGLDIVVTEVPTRVTARMRRIDGAAKTDPGDAVAIARATARGEGSRWRHQPDTETVRILTGRRESLVGEQTRAINQLRALLIEIDPARSADLARLGRSKQPLGALTTVEFGGDRHRETVGWLIRQLATECVARLERIRELESRIRDVMPPLGRHLQDQFTGCGLITAAQLVSELAGTDRFASDAKLAAWAGIAPLDASSGKQQRHRLNRGGNRQANRAIHTIVVTQARCGGEAAHYITERLNNGKTKREAIRAAKRHVARRIWKTLRDHHLT